MDANIIAVFIGIAYAILSHDVMINFYKKTFYYISKKTNRLSIFDFHKKRDLKIIFG